MRIHSFLLILLALLLPGRLWAKADKKASKELMIANYYYNHYEYHKAIPHFVSVADSLNNAEIFARLGNCYYITNNLKDADAAYARAVKMPECEDAVKLHYSEVLMQEGHYAEAEKLLVEYQKTHKSDQRVANLIAGCKSAPQVLASIPSGSVTFAGFNTDGSEFAPTLWKGRLVFTSDTVIDLKKKTDNWTGHSYYNMYSVSLDANGNCGNEYSEVSRSKDINIKYHDGPGTFSADGSLMYFTRSSYSDQFFNKKSVANKDSVVLQQIMIASDYDTAKKQFKTIKPFKYNSEDYSVEHPTISPNGNLLVFSSNMKGGAGGSDLYVCKMTGNGEWSEPENAGYEINTEGEELFPYLADDETLYFSSDGHEGLGGLDIYMSKYDPKSRAFSAPLNLGTPINSAYDDISLALYADGRSSWISSNRPGPKGGDNIWYYKRQKLYLLVNVFDAVSRRPLTDARIVIRSAKDSLRSTASSQGRLVKQLYPGENYTVIASDGAYVPKEITKMYTSDKELDTLTENIYLGNKQVYLALRVLDSTSRQPLKGVRINLRSATDSMSTTGNDDGALFTKLSPDQVYNIAIDKESYFTRFVFLNTASDKMIDTLEKNVYLSHPLFTIKNTFNPRHIPEAGDTFIVNVPFVFAAADLQRNSKDSLDEFARYLEKYSTARVLIRAHCDCRGGEQYNQDLSDRRAAEVVKYLVTVRHIDPTRLQSVGLGYKEPRIHCNNCENRRNSQLKTLDIPDGKICTEAEHAQNRILDCIVLSK